jgi:hypothetical protein
MKLAEATKFNRKSGGAQWRDLRFLSPSYRGADQENLQQPNDSDGLR